MCNHIRIIARTDDHTRYIARCEHGSLHVVWNNADYLLNRQGLDEFREILDNADAAQQMRELMTGGADADLKMIEIWFQDAGLRVRVQDLETMRELVNEALAFLDQEPAPTVTSTLQDMLAKFETTESLRDNARWN